MADTTPSYHQVASQLAANGGWLGRFGNFFGGGATPAYLGDGQPSPGSAGGVLSVGTPAYRHAPVVKPTEVVPTQSTSTETKTPIEKRSTSEQPAMAQAVYACPLDPDPFGSGPIAIIVPRQG
jgi:hypothetical protein